MFEEFEIKNLENSVDILKDIINKNKKELNTLLNIKNKTYKNFMVPYQLMSEKLQVFCTPIFHLDSVKNSKLTQKVYDKCLPIISLYETQISQNENTYRAIKDIQYKEKRLLNIEQNKVLENEIRDFSLGGCGLNDEKKDRLKEINLESSKLSKEFSQNLLDATNEWEMILDNYDDVKEIPSSDLKQASFKDKISGKIKYKFTLQMPSYISYITYGSSREKREDIYRAYTTRAPQNGKLIENILALKDEKAYILGFDNYSNYSLSTKMASTTSEVFDFLNELSLYSKDKAKKELENIKKIAFNIDGLSNLESYDIPYYSEKLKKKYYEIDEEYYRPYFEQNSVLNGFFIVLHRLFNITFILNKNAKTWDQKVKVYDIYENSKIKSRIYMDLESRENKKGGAWMQNWHSHYNIQNNTKLASAFIVCNFPPSTTTIPSLLRHSDIVTLFHEMGHALHHLLSNVNEPFVSGISGITWDTVEFPSQFLEYFSYEKEVLKLFAKHYKTGKILDNKAIDKLMDAKNFQSSLKTVRQLEFALFDFKLHLGDLKSENEIQQLLDGVRRDMGGLIPPKYNKFQNGFSHIFAGGYSAGYYSYKWAEVLSADSFYMFMDTQVFNKKLATKYRDIILGKGGSIDMDKLYISFTNRQPNIKSLLKIDGIIS
jgi:oligopeptidase A